NCESLRLRSPGFANELIRGEPSEGLKASGKVVGVDEVAQMSAQFIVGFVEVAFDGGVLDGAVHPLDLTVGPGMLGLCQAVIDIVEGAGIFEGAWKSWRLAVIALISAGDQVSPAGSVKWVPLSVRTVWTL